MYGVATMLIKINIADLVFRHG